MKSNNNITMERLKQNVASGGCSVVYLKALKSDLHRLLQQYMELTDITFDILEQDESKNLTVSVAVKEFYDIGRGE